LPFNFALELSHQKAHVTNWAWEWGTAVTNDDVIIAKPLSLTDCAKALDKWTGIRCSMLPSRGLPKHIIVLSYSNMQYIRNCQQDK
jgi:hypothetical protein